MLIQYRGLAKSNINEMPETVPYLLFLVFERDRYLLFYFTKLRACTMNSCEVPSFIGCCR